MLVLFSLLIAWAFAEDAIGANTMQDAAAAPASEEVENTDAPDVDEAPQDMLERDLAAANGETDFAGGTKRVIEVQEAEETSSINFLNGMVASGSPPALPMATGSST